MTLGNLIALKAGKQWSVTFLELLCWELLRQCYCPDLWIGPLPPRRKGGQKLATDTPFREQPQNVPALSQRQMSWPQDIPWYHQVPASPCSCQKKIFCCPIPPAEKYFLFCLCISAAPFLLLRSISPFACAFKPCWIQRDIDATQTASMSFLYLVSVSLSPHLVLRRRSPRDPRITGPAGRVTFSDPFICFSSFRNLF